MCTLIGIVAGQAIPDPLSWGLDFAMVVTFLGMVIPMVKNRATLAAVIVSATVAVIGNGLPNKMGLILAALAGVAVGVTLEGGEGEKRRRGEEKKRAEEVGV